MAQLPANSVLLKDHPIPYDPILWIIKHSAENAFLGNPVRHFQHLASRMNRKQPQPELRIARAWCCLHLCETLVVKDKYPRDFRQIEREQLEVPNFDTSLQMLAKWTPHSGEVAQVTDIYEKLARSAKKAI